MSSTRRTTRDKAVEPKIRAKLRGFPDYVGPPSDVETTDKPESDIAAAARVGEGDGRKIAHLDSTRTSARQTVNATRRGQVRRGSDKIATAGSAAGPGNHAGLLKDAKSAPTTRIDISDAIARIWVQPVEPRADGTVNRKVIGIRHKQPRSARHYLLEDLKWYRNNCVPEDRKETWRENTLKVAMTRESINLPKKSGETEQSGDFDAGYKEWSYFAVMAGHPDVDPLPDDDQAWENSTYLKFYNKPIGRKAIRDHRNRTKDESDSSISEKSAEDEADDPAEEEEYEDGDEAEDHDEGVGNVEAVRGEMEADSVTLLSNKSL